MALSTTAIAGGSTAKRISSGPNIQGQQLFFVSARADPKIHILMEGRNVSCYRGYYRCTHRIMQGCPATKQVQRSDEDPLLFHVTYHGAHTCLPKSPAAPASASAWLSQEQQQQEEKEPVDRQQQNQDLLLRFQTGLRVKTEDLELGGHGQNSLSFSFASPSTTTDSGFISRASPAFLSPTSDSTYFSFSPYSLKGGGIKLRSPESGITGANSASDSPAAADMDLMLHELDFESDFSSFFS